MYMIFNIYIYIILICILSILYYLYYIIYIILSILYYLYYIIYIILSIVRWNYRLITRDAIVGVAQKQCVIFAIGPLGNQGFDHGAIGGMTIGAICQYIYPSNIIYLYLLVSTRTQIHLI